eukprot:CAMPEP_0202960288 /NCGR_PEP_ID=MMETSP1396-20130829/4437_1 /ASSEMBLY_ACC=CAM_ASM_000872 /TAXON_ID= /ORGANISM="Pseudokeronopsis sp., Strain Brazil" /LENGTH=129 /DNA_ID=CAMNT_0049679415 /DNA_START=45 /DNA_END=434 /DNA_ORIENTATION=+
MMMGQPGMQPPNFNMHPMMGGPGGPMPNLQNLNPPQPNQPNPPQISPVEEASVEGAVDDKEKGFYSNLLEQVDPKGENKIGGQQAVTFFKRSLLPVDTLKNIWKIAARSSSEFLTRDEFYLALRLIAYA